MNRLNDEPARSRTGLYYKDETFNSKMDSFKQAAQNESDLLIATTKSIL